MSLPLLTFNRVQKAEGQNGRSLKLPGTPLSWGTSRNRLVRKSHPSRRSACLADAPWCVVSFLLSLLLADAVGVGKTVSLPQHVRVTCLRQSFLLIWLWSGLLSKSNSAFPLLRENNSIKLPVHHLLLAAVEMIQREMYLQFTSSA